MAVFVFGASVWWNGKFAVGCCAWVLFVGPFGVRDVAAFVFDTSVWWNGKFAYRILCFIGYYTMLGSFLLATPVAGDHSELLEAGDGPGCLRWSKRSPRSRGQGPVLFCNQKNTTPVIACCTGGRSRTRVSRGRLCPRTSHVLMP